MLSGKELQYVRGEISSLSQSYSSSLKSRVNTKLLRAFDVLSELLQNPSYQAEVRIRLTRILQNVAKVEVVENDVSDFDDKPTP